jgi:hypothetical protein
VDALSEVGDGLAAGAGIDASPVLAARGNDDSD